MCNSASFRRLAAPETQRKRWLPDQSIGRSMRNYTGGLLGASTRRKAAGQIQSRVAPDDAMVAACSPIGTIEAMPEPQRFDVVALGELVIDLIPTRGADGTACLAPKPGGAPGNVALGVARLGGRAAMLSKVGDDAFGRLLVETLAANGVVTDAILATREGNTSLAAVTVGPDGEREFLIYRKGSADSTYAPGEVAADVVRSAKILHVGSLWLGEPDCGAAQRHAVRIAHEAGGLVSVDVNLRPALWRNVEEMRAVALEATLEAEILKVSMEELALMADTSDVEEGVARLVSPRRRLLAVTFGSGGALLVSRDRQVRIPGLAVEVADTVGCGDAFMASLLLDIAASTADLASEDALVRMGRRAVASGAFAATVAGAMDALPTSSQRDALLLAAHSV
jgi:fructokinase